MDHLNETGIQKLSNAKAEGVLSAFKRALKGDDLTKAVDKRKANDAIREKYKTRGVKETARAKETRKMDDAVVNKERLKTYGARAGVGATGLLGLAAIAKGAKSMKGGKSVASIPPSKMKKLKALMKNRKVQMGAGVAGGTGLAAMLASKS